MSCYGFVLVKNKNELEIMDNGLFYDDVMSIFS